MWGNFCFFWTSENKTLAISSHYGVIFPKSKDAFRRHFIFKARNIYWYAKFFLKNLSLVLNDNVIVSK